MQRPLNGVGFVRPGNPRVRSPRRPALCCTADLTPVAHTPPDPNDLGARFLSAADGADTPAQSLSALQEAYARQTVELQRTRAELDQLLDASIEMSVQAEAGRSAELASRAKSEFLATISHEIRTPLHGILGNAELLLGTRLDEDQKRCVRLLRSSAQALTDILNDVLDYSKIEAGRMDLHAEPFDLGACAKDAAALFESVARDKGLRLHLQLPQDLPRAVLGDASRLRQVLLNLLANAVKFTARGEVRLEIEPAMPRDTVDPDSGTAAYRVVVQDTGIGIPADQVKLLFEPFQQLDASMTRRFGGTGLGLAISQRLVGLMGGTIQADSREGEGSRFHFTLRWPIARDLGAGAMSAPRLDASMAREQPMSILLVEDNATNQVVGLEMLGRLGYSAALAVDGYAAVEAQRKGLHDLILMDIQMPGMDGVEAARCIRALPNVQRPRIVALTANAAAQDRQAYLEAGMDDHLAKPFEMKDLAAVITRAFKARHARQTVPAEAVQVLDDAIRESLKSQFGTAFLQRLDETYLRTAAPLMQAADAAMAAGDGPALQRAAHALKSSSANVGATTLSRLCAELEVLGKQGPLKDGGPLMALTERTWLQVQRALLPQQTC
jgi:signal transduction histidine kinase/DNA-binding response OmpR family regulator